MNQVDPDMTKEESLKNSKIILLLQDKSTWIDNYRDPPQTDYLCRKYLGLVKSIKH